MDPVAQFRQLVLDGDAAALRKLLGQHPDVRARINEPLFSFDAPALVAAAGRGRREVVDALLDAGADINARSSWWAGGFGALDQDDHEMARYLIDRGAAVDAYAAARHGMLDKLRELADADPGVVHVRGGDGQTPLHVASSVEIAAFLVERGADIDARDIDHESTPVQYLVRSHPEIVRFLIARGCTTDILMAAAVGDAGLVRRHLDAGPESVHTRVHRKYFPMRNPRAGGTIYIWTLGKNRFAHQVARDEGVLALLRERTPEDLRVALACLAGDAAPVHHVESANPEYILIAAEDDNTAAVRLMLECGWPVGGDGNETPLHWACWHGNAEMAREILRFHPPLEVRDAEHNATPLEWAIYGSEHCRRGDYKATIEAVREALAG